MTEEELAFVVVLGRLGRTDREAYRKLREEAWLLVQENHSRLSSEQLETWKRNAS